MQSFAMCSCDEQRSKEIIQPTIVDPASFKLWKDEAFETWLTCTQKQTLPKTGQIKRVFFF
ncbi:unnamed protein product [Brassica oleracea var. botrytis]